jgi:hypothetical protein
MREINYNGIDYQLSPLTLGALERLGDRIDTISKDDASTIDRAKTIVDVAHESLRRKHPELKRSDVAEMIDMSNMLDVFLAIIRMSGLWQDAQKKTDEVTLDR